jgi:hypothetical protein
MTHISDTNGMKQMKAMKGLSVAAILIAATLAPIGLRGQSRPPALQGVWRAVEVTITGPGGRTITNLRPTLTVISGRHYARVEEQSEGPRPILADVARATADELRATWGPFVGEAGTYELAGETLTMHPLVAKNPAAMAAGTFIVYTCRIDGNTATVTQQRNQSGAFANPFTIKLVRVE